jgi:hypothetical protein
VVVTGVSGNNVAGYYLTGERAHGFLYNGSAYTTIDFPNFEATGTYVEGISGNNVVGFYQPSPEPAALTLAGLNALGLLGFAWWRRRKPVA